MADIYLNGLRLDFEDTGNDSTVGDLVTAVEKDLKGSKAFISALSIDGAPMEDFRLDSVLERGLSECREVRLSASTFEASALEGLNILKEYMMVTRENIAPCVHEIRLGGAGGGGFNSILQALVEIIKTMNALFIWSSKHNLSIFKENPEQYYGRLLKHLESVRAARDTGDMVSIADILEYEIAPVLEGMEKDIFNG
ncbi:MAG: hypothetical protein HZB22_07245 [Deltaproteobacteria bacterium]|nr:hypothetical protein [Deltaproteobacteria bacterium]